MAELGKLEKPDAGSFAGKRKLYCAPNVYPIKDAPEDYSGLVGRYWDEVVAQLDKLEAAGKIKKIFCENIPSEGENALEALAKMNDRASGIIKKKIEEGAVLFATEKEDIFRPFIDWAACLNVVRTHEVFTKIFGFYSELLDKRIQHAADIITGNLSEGEAGLLIMRDEDRIRLQLPSDIEIFLVTPPSYDDIIRWFREKAKDLSVGE